MPAPAEASDENDYFERSLDELGVSTQDRTAPELSDAARGFLELFRTARKSQDYGSILGFLAVAEALCAVQRPRRFG